MKIGLIFIIMFLQITICYGMSGQARPTKKQVEQRQLTNKGYCLPCGEARYLLRCISYPIKGHDNPIQGNLPLFRKAYMHIKDNYNNYKCCNATKELYKMKYEEFTNMLEVWENSIPAPITKDKKEPTP